MSAEVSVHDVGPLLAEGALLLDVREDDEWASGHVPDALHLPMSRIRGDVDRLPPDRLILYICHVGQRSAMVADALEGAGYDAVNVAGGMQAWESAGLQVVS